MADQSVTVQFGADTGGIDKGSAEVKSKLEDLQNQTNAAAGQFDKFGDSVKGATDGAVTGLGNVAKQLDGLNEAVNKAGNVSQGGGLVGLIGGLASKLGPGGLAFAGLIAGAAGAADAVHKVGEQMKELSDLADRVGVSTDRLQNLQQAFALGGVKVKDTNEAVKKLSDELRDLAFDKDGKFARQLDEWNIKWKDSSGNIIAMNRYLEEAATVMQKAASDGGGPLVAKVAEALHISEELAKVLAQGPTAFKNLESAAAAAGGKIDSDVIQKSKKLIEEWDAATVEITLRFEAWLASMGLAVLEWAKKIKPLIVDAFTNWMRGASENYQDTLGKMTSTGKFNEDFGASFGTQAQTAIDAFKTKFSSAMTSAASETKQTTADIKDLDSNLSKTAKDWTFVDDKKKGKADTSEMTGLREELDQIHEKYSQLKLQESDDVATFKKTEAQKVADLRAALDDREKATDAVFAQELTLAADNANKRAQIERAFNKEMASIQAERLKLQVESDKKSMQEWQTDIQGIASAFNGQLAGLLGHTETWGQAMAKIGQQVVMKLIEEFEKLLIIQPLLKMISGAGLASPQSAIGGAVSGAGGAAGGGLFGPLLTAMGLQTSATTAQAAATSAQTVAGTANTVSTAANTAATTANTAAEGTSSAGGLFGFLSKLIPSFDVGTNYVPQTGLAMIHEGEAIVPAGYNTSGLGGGGGFQPAGGVSFQVQALDSAGVQAFFNRYGPQIAKVLSAHMQQNPSFGT